MARDYAVYIEEQVRSVFIDMLLATALVVAVVLLIFLREGALDLHRARWRSPRA